MSVTKKLKIRGIVQGVGFRYSMCAEAEQLGVTGWVRNAPDGSVEAVVQGTESQVHALIEWARKGPSGSRVEKVEVTEAAGQFDDFSISY